MGGSYKNYSNKFLGIALAVLLLPYFALAQVTTQSAQASYNWAGYAAEGSNFSFITGTWNVPQVLSTGNFSGDGTWVGIGGLNSNDLIQAGTQALVSPSGYVSYNAWYEVTPSATQALPNFNVHAGDSITASLQLISASQWQISLRNNTSGQTFQTFINFYSSQSSAEWIQEMLKQSDGSNIPLDNFSNVNFFGSYALANGSQIRPYTQLFMVDRNFKTLAYTSGIGQDGYSFTVSNQPISQVSQAQPLVAYQTSPQTQPSVLAPAPSPKPRQVIAYNAAPSVPHPAPSSQPAGSPAASTQNPGSFLSFTDLLKILLPQLNIR